MRRRRQIDLLFGDVLGLVDVDLDRRQLQPADLRQRLDGRRKDVQAKLSKSGSTEGRMQEVTGKKDARRPAPLVKVQHPSTARARCISLSREKTGVKVFSMEMKCMISELPRAPLVNPAAAAPFTAKTIHLNVEKFAVSEEYALLWP